MKLPKIPKIFKKNYLVIYVIIFLLIVSVLVFFYFKGFFREGALTIEQQKLSPTQMEINANYNVEGSKTLANIINKDVKDAKIPLGSTLTGNTLSKVQSEFDTITAEKSRNLDYSNFVDKGKPLNERHNWASQVQSNYSTYKTNIPGCDMTEDAKKKKKDKDPTFKIIDCPIKDASSTNPGNILSQYVK